MIQLLRGERRHSLARAVFHGRKGEVRQKYQDGLEDQLGALGLVVNIIVLWNTLYMNKIIEHLKATGVEVREEDVKRLTPLGHDHIRLTGRYDFKLTASLNPAVYDHCDSRKTRYFSTKTATTIPGSY